MYLRLIIYIEIVYMYLYLVLDIWKYLKYLD